MKRIGDRKIANAYGTGKTSSATPSHRRIAQAQLDADEKEHYGIVREIFTELVRRGYLIEDKDWSYFKEKYLGK